MTDYSLQMNIVTEDPLNAGTPRQALNHELTPNALFYVRNHFDILVPANELK